MDHIHLKDKCKICQKKANKKNHHLCTICCSTFCDEHIAVCAKCFRFACVDEIFQCEVCKKMYCNKEEKKCEECGKITCGHCQKNVHCFLCNAKGCWNCIQDKCHACSTLKRIHLSETKKYGLLYPTIYYWEKGENNKTTVLVGYRLFVQYILLLNEQKEVIFQTKKVSFHPLKGIRKWGRKK